jgi:hypothetical protein
MPDPIPGAPATPAPADSVAPAPPPVPSPEPHIAGTGTPPAPAPPAPTGEDKRVQDAQRKMHEATAQAAALEQENAALRHAADALAQRLAVRSGRPGPTPGTPAPGAPLAPERPLAPAPPPTPSIPFTPSAPGVVDPAWIDGVWDRYQAAADNKAAFSTLVTELLGRSRAEVEAAREAVAADPRLLARATAHTLDHIGELRREAATHTEISKFFETQVPGVPADKAAPLAWSFAPRAVSLFPNDLARQADYCVREARAFVASLTGSGRSAAAADAALARTQDGRLPGGGAGPGVATAPATGSLTDAIRAEQAAMAARGVGRY